MKDLAYVILFIFLVLLLVLAVFGWFINIYELYLLATNGATITADFVLRAIGIFVAPLGAFLGWFL